MLAGALSLQSQCAQIDPVARHRRTPEIASGNRQGELEKRVCDAVVRADHSPSCASKAVERLSERDEVESTEALPRSLRP